ncbi:MAG: hypothetical protein OK457_06305 [Thaumarchaeota archaeon]|nr:hypothetical protein [Nitrososphaerota archaeon]
MTTGNPLELFHELERIFESELEVQKHAEPELKETPLDGVAKFAWEIRSASFTDKTTRRRAEGTGVALVALAAIVFVIILLYFGLILNFNNLILFAGVIALVIFTAYCFGYETIIFRGSLVLQIRGEAYEAKTKNSREGRASVLSRARLRTFPYYDDNSSSEELRSELSEKQHALDESIRKILPRFEVEKTEFPGTKS